MSGNTIDPRLLSELPTDQNQMFDPSQPDANDLVDFTSATFDLDTLNYDAFPMSFDEDTGNKNGDVEEPAPPASAIQFDPIATAQMFAKAPQEMVPIAQSVQPSPATIFPAIPPGYAFHPQVGWYMPMPPPPQFAGAAPFGMMPPRFPLPPMPMPVQAAVHQVPALASAPKKQVTKKLEPLRPKRGTRNGKSGPAVYFEEQAQRRAAGDDSGPRAVSRDYEYGQQGTDPSKPAKQRSGRGGGHMKDLKNATVQRCRCLPAKNEAKTHVPRPRNAFMIFRNDFSAQWCTGKGRKRGNDNTNISIEAGRAWKALGEQDAARYKARAAAEAREHKELNPEYTYTPMKGIQAKFGQPDCTCGAYKANMAEYHRQQSGGATPPNTFKIPGDAHDADEYVAPRTRSSSRNNSTHVPTAQMIAPALGTDMPDLDFDLDFDFDFKDENVNLDWQNLQDFEDVEDDEAGQPPAKKRRSARNSSKSVHYADPDDEDEQEAEQTTASTARKHRPPPISTSRQSSTASKLSALNSADFQLFANDGESVASRTRSKSNSGSEDEGNLLPTGKSSLASLFEDSEGENIVVATPKTPNSAKAKVSPAKSDPPKASSLVLPPHPKRQTRSQSRGRVRRRS